MKYPILDVFNPPQEIPRKSESEKNLCSFIVTLYEIKFDETGHGTSPWPNDRSENDWNSYY